MHDRSHYFCSVVFLVVKCLYFILFQGFSRWLLPLRGVQLAVDRWAKSALLPFGRSTPLLRMSHEQIGSALLNILRYLVSLIWLFLSRVHVTHSLYRSGGPSVGSSYCWNFLPLPTLTRSFSFCHLFSLSQPFQFRPKNSCANWQRQIYNAASWPSHENAGYIPASVYLLPFKTLDIRSFIHLLNRKLFLLQLPTLNISEGRTHPQVQSPSKISPLASPPMAERATLKVKR